MKNKGRHGVRLNDITYLKIKKLGEKKYMKNAEVVNMAIDMLFDREKMELSETEIAKINDGE